MQNFTSIPFKTHKFHGMAEVNGFAKFSSAGVVLEFEAKLIGLVPLGVEEKRIPIAQILDVKFKKGVFKRGSKIEIRTRSLAAMEGIPNEDGKIVLKLKFDDFERGREAVERMQRDVDGYVASLPPPHVSIASTFDGSEDDTEDLGQKHEQ